MDKTYTVTIEGLGEFTGTKDQIRLLADMIWEAAQKDFDRSIGSEVPELYLEDFDRKSMWSSDLAEFADNL